MSEAKQWIGLLDETRYALANLRTEDLEELAERAQRALASNVGVLPPDHRELAARHRVLGEVIAATGQNLNVLRRLRGLDGSQRWVR
jgi:hypothetical protein